MSINDIKFDHFKNIEELIQHLEMWYAEDDYDAYNRFFRLRDARIMGMIIYQLTNNWNELEELIDEEKTRLAKECSHTYEDSLGKTKYVNEDIFNELNNILDKMNEIKEGKNVSDRD